MHNIFFWSVQVHTDILFLDNIQTKQNLFTTFDFFLFVWGLSSHSKSFHSYGDVIITGEGLQVFDLCSALMVMSSKDSLACHTYSDEGYTFIMVNSEDPWHSNILPIVWHWSWQCLLLRNKSVSAGIRTPNLPHAGPTNYNICCRLFDVHVLLQILQECDFLNKMQWFYSFIYVLYILQYYCLCPSDGTLNSVLNVG